MNSLEKDLSNNDEMETPPLLNVEGNTDTSRVELSLRTHGIPVRYVVAIWVFFGFMCLFISRVNLSFAIVLMTTPQSTKTQSGVSCPFSNNNNNNSSSTSSSYHIQGEFDWSPKTQGMILGSFFYGYIFTQLIGGMLSERYGAKWFFGGSVLIPGILTFLTPFAARLHVGLLIAIRLLMGVFAGPVFPSASVLWGRWIPPFERSIVPPSGLLGVRFGIIIAGPLVSLLSSSRLLGNWPSVFYVSGILSCLWFIGWCFYAYNSPSEHPRITDEEKQFLFEIIPKPKKTRIPWGHILTCMPVYAYVIQHVCTDFIFGIIVTSLPTYYSTILRFNLQQNVLMFNIPYIILSIVIIVVGQIVDRIRAKGILSTTTTRKCQTIIGGLGTSLFLVLINFVGCNRTLAVTFITISVSFIGFQLTGSLISYLDIANNYAGTLLGIANTIGSGVSFIAPIFVGWMTNNNQTLEAWKWIFNITASVVLFGSILYCMLFNGEEQSWNQDNDVEE